LLGGPRRINPPYTPQAAYRRRPGGWRLCLPLGGRLFGCATRRWCTETQGRPRNAFTAPRGAARPRCWAWERTRARLTFRSLNSIIA